MKKGIHPVVIEDSVISCDCGASFSIPSIKKGIHIEICSNCSKEYNDSVVKERVTGKIQKFRDRQKKSVLSN